jgi:DNA replication licensing factor MCM3
MLDDASPEDVILTERQHKFEEFLQSEYTDEISGLVRNTDQTRLIVNVDVLRDYKRDFADGLLREPVEYLPALDLALREVIKATVGEEKAGDLERFNVGLSGSFGDHQVSPRTLSASHLGKMISLEGIITRCSLVRPKMLKSVHYCPETRLFHERPYRDGTSSISNLPPTSSITPQHDDEGHQLQMEYGLCTFRDHQRISIQEMPERAPAGQLPRSTDIILDDDLVDKCKPGDRIQLVGVYRSIGGGSSGAFRCVYRVFLPTSVSHRFA